MIALAKKPGLPVQVGSVALRGSDQMKLANWKIATYALYLLGGASKSVHTEEIALKCYELAPDTFSWVKYPQYPDKDIVRSALMDARKGKNGSLVIGRSGRGPGQSSARGPRHTGDGWQLTQSGTKWIMSNQNALSMQLRQREPSTHRQITRKKLSRLTKHPLFHRFHEQPDIFSPQLGEMAELFRCRVDAEAALWQSRIETFRNLAELVENREVLEFLARCETVLGSTSG